MDRHSDSSDAESVSSMSSSTTSGGFLAVPPSSPGGSVRKKKLKAFQNSIRGLKFTLKEEMDPLLVANHEFVECTYHGPTWCGHCSDFIWGFSKQGWKCKQCGLDCHSRCVNHVTALCTEGGKKSPSTHSFGEWADGEDSVSKRLSTLSSTDDDIPNMADLVQSISKKGGGTVRMKNSKSALIVKLHVFNEAVFKGPTWCKHCNNFIFGFQKSGYKCQACGIEVHDKCVHNVRFTCHSKEIVEGLDQLSMMKQHRRSSLSVAMISRNASPTDTFIVEDGHTEFQAGSFDYISQMDSSHPLVENPEASLAWYRLYFMNQEHDQFITGSKETDPFVMSILREARNHRDGSKSHQYRVIVWLKTGKEQTVIPLKNDQSLSAGQVLEIAYPPLASKKKSLRILPRGGNAFADLSKELLIMEREQASLDFKIGIIYAKKGQKHEDELFSNKDGSPQFNKFLDLLGEKVDLKVWQGFRGGLPTNEGSSYFTEFCGNKIMFHVSTLLPYNENDPQKLDRKRHIGNDIVSIVFYDEPDACFSPSIISSHFLHTYAVVTPTTNSDKTPYKVNVVSNREVPRFGPELPSPPIFEDPKGFREFLLAKLINAEKAAYFAPAFLKRRIATLESLLQHLHSKYRSEAKKTSKLNSDPNKLSPGSIRKDKKLIISTNVETGSDPEAPVTPWEDYDQLPTSPTPWEEYDVLPLWEVVDEQDDGKQLRYDVKTS